ncbi:hypothetical protein TNCT_67661, partial [Trichonephila clavata]
TVPGVEIVVKEEQETKKVKDYREEDSRISEPEDEACAIFSAIQQDHKEKSSGTSKPEEEVSTIFSAIQKDIQKEYKRMKRKKGATSSVGSVTTGTPHTRIYSERNPNPVRSRASSRKWQGKELAATRTELLTKPWNRAKGKHIPVSETEERKQGWKGSGAEETGKRGI